jgi:hypothetical protein
MREKEDVKYFLPIDLIRSSLFLMLSRVKIRVYTFNVSKSIHLHGKSVGGIQNEVTIQETLKPSV